MIFEHQVLQKKIQLVQHSLCNMTSSALSLDIRNAIISLWSYFQRPSSLPDLNIICFKFSQILFNFLNSLIYWKIMKIFKYLACTCPAHFWSCMFQSKAKKMWWASSQNPKNRLRAVVAAGGGYIIDIQIFLVEKCHRLMEIKGFGHKFLNNLRIRASFRPHN